MTVTLTTRLDSSPALSSLLNGHCAVLAAAPDPNLSLLRSALGTGLRVGRIAAIATNMARLRDELADDVDDLRAYCASNLADLRAMRAHYERLETDHAHYMWAYYAPDLTEADVLAYCMAILDDHSFHGSHVPPILADLAAAVRRDAERQAHAALQGWTDRTAQTGASL